MLIPSIDLMGGKIVQLVQGEKKALEFDDFNEWIDRFRAYPLVQLVDLDAAKGHGENRNQVTMLCRQLPCQVGGGIRSLEAARAVLALGAQRIVIGSALIAGSEINISFAEHCAAEFGARRLTFAIDSRGGKVAIKGWKEVTGIEPLSMIRVLENHCGAFLYTHIDTEGTLSGFPLEQAQVLRRATSRQLIVAGGINSMAEIEALDAMGVDAVVGMAIYRGKIGGSQMAKAE
jgi:phosphoribosylformimino-5-aminoimidazole carboxamide ribotide isomerase